MDIHLRAQQVAERLADGRLPTAKSMRMWTGFGNGKLCDGCGDAIPARDVEHEHDLESRPSLRFHAACSVLWTRVIASPDGVAEAAP